MKITLNIKIMTFILLFTMHIPCFAGITKLWEKSFEDGEYLESPLIDSKDNLYFGISYKYDHRNLPETLYAYAGKSGELLWNKEIRINNQGLIGKENTLYFSRTEIIDASIVAIDSLSGKIKWENKEKHGNLLAISPDLNTIFDGVTTLDTNGTIMSHFKIHLSKKAWLDTPPVIATNGNVYTGDTAGKLHAFNQKGKELWSTPLLKCLMTNRVGEVANHTIMGQPIIDKNNQNLYVFARCDKDNWETATLYRVSLSDHKIVWQKRYDPIYKDLPKLKLSPYGELYFVTKKPEDFVVLALDKNGNELWQFNLGARLVWQKGEITIRPSGNLLIASEDSLIEISPKGRFISNYRVDIWERKFNAPYTGYYLMNKNNNVFYAFSEREYLDGYQHIQLAAYRIDV